MALPSLPSQNRKVVRLRCSYEVSCVMYGKRFKARVVDMGLEGMRLQIECRAEKGTLIGIRYDGPPGCYAFDTVQARVVWSRGAGSLTEIGVAYTHPPAYLERSWVRHLLRVFDVSHMSVEDRRRHVRVPVFLPAAVTDLENDDATGAATIRDIGHGGALLESSTDLPLGSQIRIELESPNGLPVACEGHVVRKTRVTRGERWLFGVRFAGPPPTDASNRS